MRDHLSKIIIVALLVAIVGVPILLRPAGGAADAPADAPRLVIYTPHNEQIRYEIERAFNKHRAESGLPEVVFDWRTPGGTKDIRKSILSQYNKLIKSDELGKKGIGVDLFFGGGEYDHEKITSGIAVEGEQGNTITHRIVMDPEIDQALFDAAFPQPLIGGEKLYAQFSFEETNEQQESGTVEIIGWTGVTLSSFGIVYNNDVLDQLGIHRPGTWADLTNPKLRGWVALADPGHSGSIAATFETILKRQGWTEGWATLRMVYANARYFATDSSRVPVDVSRGDAAAGMCIDFYGRFQTGSIGGGRMGYADPVVDGRSMTATTADPITLLRGAPSPELARAFIAWLLTPDAQALWQRAVVDSDDGLLRPERYELRRQPIRADLYTQSKSAWVDQELNPFPTAVPFPEGTPGYYVIVAPVTKAMATDIHEDLVLAWQTLTRARETNHPNLAEMETAFFALPEEITLVWPDDELAKNWHAIHHDPGHQRHNEVLKALEGFATRLRAIENMDAKRVQWRAFFKSNYREVVRLGKE